MNELSSSSAEIQIERDVSRTFPLSEAFLGRESQGQQSLTRVLRAFHKYDSRIGYVQGMNFIVGSLLLHCAEEITFWLFVSLIDDYQMREIFKPQIPGLYMHVGILEHLMEQHLPRLY
jgi:hypothetical protein